MIWSTDRHWGWVGTWSLYFQEWRTNESIPYIAAQGNASWQFGWRGHRFSVKRPLQILPTHPQPKLGKTWPYEPGTIEIVWNRHTGISIRSCNVDKEVMLVFKEPCLDTRSIIQIVSSSLDRRVQTLLGDKINDSLY